MPSSHMASLRSGGGPRPWPATLDRMKIYVNRKGPGDPGDKLSVKIKLLTDRRPHLPEIQHIVMQIKQGAGERWEAHSRFGGARWAGGWDAPSRACRAEAAEGRGWSSGPHTPAGAQRSAPRLRTASGSEWRCGCSEAAGTPTPSSLGGTGGAGQGRGWVRWARGLWGWREMSERVLPSVLLCLPSREPAPKLSLPEAAAGGTDRWMKRVRMHMESGGGQATKAGRFSNGGGA